MGKKYLEVSKDGFITVYPAIDVPRHGCSFQNIVAVILKRLKRKRKY